MVPFIWRVLKLQELPFSHIRADPGSEKPAKNRPQRERGDEIAQNLRGSKTGSGSDGAHLLVAEVERPRGFWVGEGGNDLVGSNGFEQRKGSGSQVRCVSFVIPRGQGMLPTEGIGVPKP